MLDDGRIILPTEWNQWSFEGEFLIDDAYNKYHINDIRALFFQRQLQSTLLGNKNDIVCLKHALEKRVKELNSHIIIKLINDDKTIKELKFNI